MMSDNVTEQDDFCPMHGESVAHVKVAGGEPGCTCPSAPPASSNDVTITELDDGALVVQQIGLPDGVIYPEVAAALRARFASERMPEDVRELVDESYGNVARDLWGWANLAARLRDALEAAYSQKGDDGEPR